MPGPFLPLLASFWSALGGDPAALATIELTGTGALPSAFPVTDFASAAVTAATLAAREIHHTGTGARPPIAVDRRLCSFWFGLSIRPQGWSLPALRNPITGDYRTRDGWIRIHANAPRHRAAALRVLGCDREAAQSGARDGGNDGVRDCDAERVARTIASASGTELESAILAAGGCAAQMRTCEQWRQHPQGIALAAEPLIQLSQTDGAPRAPRGRGCAARPLTGLRVLDLTRVLAGPVATRFLAGYGAEVLRIDPPEWDEPGVVPEVTLGKRCARLNLRAPADRVAFEALLRDADLLIHGYRPGALAALGYSEQTLEALAPGLVEVSLDAYGWTGPWAARRGFDSLVQMSAGIAAAGMTWRGAAHPVPLPVQALDHATGYLMAAAALRGWAVRLTTNRGSRARLSLARTALALIDCATPAAEPPLRREDDDDLHLGVEATSWGPARRLLPPVAMAGTPLRWTLPATALGSAAACW